MASSYLMYALWYNRAWGLAVAFTAPNRVPLHDWRKYASTGMTHKEVIQFYEERVRKQNRKNICVAVLTGPYLIEANNPHMVVDIDSLPGIESREEKESIMKSLAKEGYIVVNTPRGLHIHALAAGDPPYMLVVVHEKERPEKIGDGGCTYPHPWTSPPSVRPHGDNKWFRYSFVLPDGRKVAKYDTRVLEKLVERPRVTVEDIQMDLELYLGTPIRLVRASPMASGGPPTASVVKDVVGDREPAKKKPIYYDMDEFHAKGLSFPLPNCVAWPLFNYYQFHGFDMECRSISAWCRWDMLGTPIPYGTRFIISVAFVLFMTHIVMWVTFDELTDILSVAVEAWPEDEQMPLDRKLQYVLLRDEKGFVHPRYGGLGTLTPMSVLPRLCETCFFYGTCRGRNPWKAYRRWLRPRILARIIQSVEE